MKCDIPDIAESLMEKQLCTTQQKHKLSAPANSESDATMEKTFSLVFVRKYKNF